MHRFRRLAGLAALATGLALVGAPSTAQAGTPAPPGTAAGAGPAAGTTSGAGPAAGTTSGAGPAAGSGPTSAAGLAAEPRTGAGHGPVESAGAAVTPDDLAAARDGRAAAGDSADRAGSSLVGSWPAGTVAAGATQAWVWNNASHSMAYHVGFSGSVVTPQNTPCEFEVVRSSHIKYAGGERRFAFVIQNVGTIACATDILLAGLDGIVMATPTLAAGQQQEWWWNNSTPGYAYLAGVNPISSGGVTCRFEIQRPNYQIGAEDDLQFHFTVRNVGSSPCAAELRLTGKAMTSSGLFDTSLPLPGFVSGLRMAQDRRLPTATSVLLPGLFGMTPRFCRLTVADTIHRQFTTPSGTDRLVRFEVVNDGLVDCYSIYSIHLGVARIAP